MNKIILSLFVFLLSISLASALEFDNVKSYDAVSKTVTITNAFGLGETIGTAKLKTPQYNVVPVGYSKVMEYELDSADIYLDGFGKMFSYNVNDKNKEIERTYDIKIKSYQSSTRDTYNLVTLGNGTEERQNNGTEVYQKEVWTDIKDIPKGKITIGIFTNVKKGDVIDLVPTLFGEVINEWAIFAADPQIIAYWNFDEVAGQVAASFNTANQLNVSLTTIVDGKINKARNYSGVTNSYSENRSLLGVGTTTGISACGWAYITDAEQYDTIFAWRDVGVSFNYWTYFSDTSTLSTTPSGGVPQQSVTYTDYFNKWTHICTMLNATQVQLYINGSLIGTTNHVTSWSNLNLITIGSDRETQRTRVANGMIDEVVIFNRTLDSADVAELYNNGDGLAYPFGIINVSQATITSPSNNSYIYSKNSSETQFTLNVGYLPANATSVNCYYNSTYNSTLASISCGSNTAITLINTFGQHTIYTNVTDSNGNSFTNQTTITIHRNYFNNQTAFETENTNYSLELWNLSIAPSNYNFTYNGVAYNPTLINLGNNKYILNQSLETILNVNPISFYWAFQDTQQRQSDTYTQITNQTILAQCNSTMNTIYWRILFKNETISQENINATLSGNIGYWLGSGEIIKTLSYANSSEFSSYTFCLLPTYKKLFVNTTLSYSNSESIQRTTTFNNYELTNTTTNSTLYLLPTITGIFSRYITLTSAGSILSGVQAVVTRTIGGSTVQIGSGMSDNSGLFAIFLDPLSSYNYVFSKVGYNNNQFTLTPNSNEPYSVYMTATGGTTFVQNGTSIGTNLSYSTTPINSTLLNNTAYTFSLNVSGNGIIFISMNITNSSGQQQQYAEGVNGIISANINTLNNSFFTGSYVIRTNTETITFVRTWSIGNYYTGTYSLFAIATSWAAYKFQNDYYRIVIILLTILLSIGGLSKIEIIDTSEAKIWTGTMIIWAFSYVGWLMINIAVLNPESGFYVLNQFANKYLMAIIATVLATAFSLKEVYT